MGPVCQEQTSLLFVCARDCIRLLHEMTMIHNDLPPEIPQIITKYYHQLQHRHVNATLKPPSNTTCCRGVRTPGILHAPTRPARPLCCATSTVTITRGMCRPRLVCLVASTHLLRRVPPSFTMAHLWRLQCRSRRQALTSPGQGQTRAPCFGPGLYVTTTLQEALNYAIKGHRPKGGAVFKLRVDLGNCYTVEQNDPNMSTWQQKGYDSAWSAHGANGTREEHCIKDPRPTRVQILDIILANTRQASEGGFTVENGRIVQRGTMGQPEGLKREPSNDLCVICMDEKATHAIVPCGHQCLCLDCAGLVDKCPMCRVAKQSVIKIFR